MMKNSNRKNNILTIMKKELRRVFGDRRMLLGIVLPGLMIYLLYSFMGNTMMKSFDTNEDTVYTVQIEGMPTSLETAWQNTGIKTEAASYATVDEAKDALADKKLHLYAIFPADFEAQVLAYDPASGQPAPHVELYYNSASTVSAGAYSAMTEMLNAYESTMTNRFDINLSADTKYDLASAEDTTGMIFAMLMPMLLMTLLFSACMTLAPESISGEKERGTIATLLVTPLRRSELALGKLFSLSILSLISSLISFLAILLSLPKLMGGDTNVVDATIYGVTDYAWILGIIVSTTLLFVAAISVISAYANSIKEANGLVTPLMIVVMLVSLIGRLGGGGMPALPMFLIPVYNSAQCISGVFGGSYEPMQMILTIASNAVVTGLLVVLLTRMFNSEKVMFKK